MTSRKFSTSNVAVSPGQVRRVGNGQGDAHRAVLGRQLRSLRWGTLVLGAAATAVFSGLAMHQSTATAGGAASAVEQTSSSNAPSGDAPSQSLFQANSGFSQVSLPPSSRSFGSRGDDSSSVTSPNASVNGTGSSPSTGTSGQFGSSASSGFGSSSVPSIGRRVRVRSSSS